MATTIPTELVWTPTGDGPPVVLLHSGGMSSRQWRSTTQALSPSFRVIAPDLRGYGETDKPASGYDKRTMALDIVGLLKTLGIQKFALIGHDR